MVRDFGPGMSIDELVGMPAWVVHNLELPPGKVYQPVIMAAGVMVGEGLESFVLAELWEDGHTVWHSTAEDKPVVVKPSGQLIRSQG